MFNFCFSSLLLLLIFSALFSQVSLLVSLPLTLPDKTPAFVDMCATPPNPPPAPPASLLPLPSFRLPSTHTSSFSSSLLPPLPPTASCRPFCFFLCSPHKKNKRRQNPTSGEILKPKKAPYRGSTRLRSSTNVMSIEDVPDRFLNFLNSIFPQSPVVNLIYLFTEMAWVG